MVLGGLLLWWCWCGGGAGGEDVVELCITHKVCWVGGWCGCVMGIVGVWLGDGDGERVPWRRG